MKIKKTKKSKGMRGYHMGTHGGGARKNRKGSGHRGGKGMSGSGKRADHKKTLVQKKFGHGYFGKKGITSKKTEKDRRLRINLQQIELNLKKYKDSKGKINLEKYKILGKGEVENKLVIIAKEASKSALEKVKAKGGEIILPVKKEKIATKENSKKDVQKK